MSETFYDELGELVNRHRSADAAAKEKSAADARMDALDGKLDAVLERLSVNDPPSPTPPPVGDDGTGDPAPVPSPADADPPLDPPAPELPVQRVTKLGVPRVYTGDDEPSEVEYIDEESGETRKRAGRRKGQPTIWQVDNVEIPAADSDAE